MQMMGSTLPFPRTPAEGAERGDPRPSIAERYASGATRISRASGRPAVSSWRSVSLLAEDVAAVVERAGRQWDLFQADLHPNPSPRGGGARPA